MCVLFPISFLLLRWQWVFLLCGGSLGRGHVKDTAGSGQSALPSAFAVALSVWHPVEMFLPQSTFGSCAATYLHSFFVCSLLQEQVKPQWPLLKLMSFGVGGWLANTFFLILEPDLAHTVCPSWCPWGLALPCPLAFTGASWPRWHWACFWAGRYLTSSVVISAGSLFQLLYAYLLCLSGSLLVACLDNENSFLMKCLETPAWIFSPAVWEHSCKLVYSLYWM